MYFKIPKYKGLQRFYVYKSFYKIIEYSLRL
jgi:hypothetical protein